MSTPADRRPPAGHIEAVLGAKRAEMDELQRQGAISLFKRQALTMPLPPSLHDALRVPRGRYALVGEIRDTAPVHGLGGPHASVGELARAFEASGFSAVSVATDTQFLKGAPQNLVDAAQNTALPVLCVDFVIDPIQVFRARAFGASGLLLVADLLDEELLRGLVRLARGLSLDPVVEAHSAAALDRAVRSGVRIIAINPEHPDTLEQDPLVPERLVHKIPDWAVRVAVVANPDRDAVEALAQAGFDAFVVRGGDGGRVDIASIAARILDAAGSY